MEAPHDSYGLIRSRGGSLGFFLWILLLPFCLPPFLPAEEKISGEGEHRGLIVSEGKRTVRVGPVKSGQTIQVFCTPQWNVEAGGRVVWVLTDGEEKRLRSASQKNPDTDTLLLEWTSNSTPAPKFYRVEIGGSGGGYGGEILGRSQITVSLRDQNDGNAGTDAPETHAKALLLPAPEPGTYRFPECFASGAADVYDIFQIHLPPDHSLHFEATPLQWKGHDPKGRVRWEFLNKTYKSLKKGQNTPAQADPFSLRVFHPPVKSDPKPGVYYFLVKIEGDISLFYSLTLEIKEGR
jgi:hypothetical protein